MLSTLSLFDDFFYPRHSVYVVSDSQLAAWKRDQAEAEITQLNRLIDSHKQSIERLESTVKELRKDYPQLTEAEDSEAE